MRYACIMHDCILNVMNPFLPDSIGIATIQVSAIGRRNSSGTIFCGAYTLKYIIYCTNHNSQFMQLVDFMVAICIANIATLYHRNQVYITIAILLLLIVDIIVEVNLSK